MVLERTFYHFFHVSVAAHWPWALFYFHALERDHPLLGGFLSIFYFSHNWEMPWAFYHHIYITVSSSGSQVKLSDYNSRLTYLFLSCLQYTSPLPIFNLMLKCFGHLIHFRMKYCHQNFVAVPYSKEAYGKFYSGDSYIVLNVSRIGHLNDEEGESNCVSSVHLKQTRLDGDKLKWDIHFWLGKDTSQVNPYS